MMNESVQYIYWIEHGVAMGYLIAWYLWLISLAEGTHIVAHLSWLYYRTEDYRPLEKVGTFQPFIILALVPLFLVVDLAHPERFYTMFYNWHWTSPVAYGVYIITLCMVSYAIHAYYLFRPELMHRAAQEGSLQSVYRFLVLNHVESGEIQEIRKRQERRERIWAGVSLFFSFTGLIYLGILLSSFKGRVMWHSSVMVFIFFSFGACSGAAFLILLTHLKNAATWLNSESFSSSPWWHRPQFSLSILSCSSIRASAAAWRAKSFSMGPGPSSSGFFRWPSASFYRLR
jgi:formate-dependent nitrite reductase membrane component NrfD